MKVRLQGAEPFFKVLVFFYRKRKILLKLDEGRIDDEIPTRWLKLQPREGEHPTTGSMAEIKEKYRSQQAKHIYDMKNKN